MRVSVCTIQRGRAERLRRQHEALEREGIDHVVVTMDPERSTGNEIARAWMPVADREPLPLAAARNRAAQIALGDGADLLIFLDVDCIPLPGAIAQYAHAAHAHPAALLAGPIRYVQEDADDEVALRAAPHPGRPAPRAGEVRAEHRYELLWSASFAARAETWIELAGFDEGYRGYGCEDTDFALRARARRIPFLWVGGADVYHLAHPPQTVDDWQLPALLANVGRFESRWGYEPMPTTLAALRAAGHI